MSKNNDSDTCVILVCVTNKQNKVLTHDKFFKMFISFGKILRILIFERAVIWKTFIEYDNYESAIQARMSMNGSEFSDDGMKMNVYASQLKCITFQENNSGGVDYSILRQKIDEKNHSQSQNLAYSPQINFHRVTSNQHPNKSLSQSTSPIYGKQSTSQAQKQNLSNSAQFPFAQSIQIAQQNSFQGSLGSSYKSNYNPSTINHNFDMIQHQISLYQAIQQQVQKTNHLMYTLQQVNAEQQYQVQMYYNNSQPSNDYTLQLIERQQQLVKDLWEAQNKINSQLDQYQNFLTRWHSMWSSQDSIQISFPAFGQISEIIQVGDSAQKLISDQRVKVKNPWESCPIQAINYSNNNNNNLSSIAFVKSCDVEVENQKDIDKLLSDDDQLLKQASKEQIAPTKQEDQVNFDVGSVQDSIYDDEDDEQFDQVEVLSKKSQEVHTKNEDTESPEVEQDLYDCFQRTTVTEKFDAKHILSKLNVDMNGVDDVSQLSVLAQIESQTQQLTHQKSSNSVEQIDQLINKSKQKQHELLLMKNVRHDQQQKKVIFSQQQYGGPGTTEQWSPKTEYQTLLYDDVTENSDPAEYVNPLFLKIVRKSKVIYARWFYKKIVTMKMLVNVFSTFGNIDKMIYLQQRSSALIQYQSLEHATMAKDSLNDIMFYGQSIKIFYSNYETIYLKSVNKDEQEEYYQGCDDTHRYKDNHTYSFNPPSDTILVANLTKESCTEEGLFHIFEPFGRILKHKFVYHPSNRNSCSLKYESVETSLIVLANLSGALIDGRAIVISFSKQRL